MPAPLYKKAARQPPVRAPAMVNLRNSILAATIAQINTRTIQSVVCIGGKYREMQVKAVFLAAVFLVALLPRCLVACIKKRVFY
jgi:hypothetical protein